jgi:hypothetical protein
MVFRDAFYHADPHPGNFIVLEDGVLGIIDCGMVGRLDSEMRDEIETLLLALVGRDSQRLADAVVRIGHGHWLRIPLGKLRNDRYVPLHPQLVELELAALCGAQGHKSAL